MLQKWYAFHCHQLNLQYVTATATATATTIVENIHFFPNNSACMDTTLLIGIGTNN